MAPSPCVAADPSRRIAFAMLLRMRAVSFTSSEEGAPAPVSKDGPQVVLSMVRDGAEPVIGPRSARTRWRLFPMRCRAIAYDEMGAARPLLRSPLRGGERASHAI